MSTIEEKKLVRVSLLKLYISYGYGPTIPQIDKSFAILAAGKY